MKQRPPPAVGQNTELLRGGGQHQAEGCFDPHGCGGSPLWEPGKAEVRTGRSQQSRNGTGGFRGTHRSLAVRHGAMTLPSNSSREKEQGRHLAEKSASPP